MKNLTVTVNGVAYNVTVEENTNGAAPVAAAPAAAPAAAKKAVKAAPIRHPPLHLLRLLHLPHPLPLVLFLSTLPCRAPSWTSRSRQALLLRLAMLS